MVYLSLSPPDVPRRRFPYEIPPPALSLLGVREVWPASPHVLGWFESNRVPAAAGRVAADRTAGSPCRRGPREARGESASRPVPCFLPFHVRSGVCESSGHRISHIF